jgi:CBS domain-containing protein
MTGTPRTCTRGSSLNDAARVMWEADCGFVPVVEADGSERVVGVLTDRDICMAAYTTGLSLKEVAVDRVMATEVHACREQDSLSEAEAVMQEHQIRRLPVVGENDRIVGVVSLADLAVVASEDQAKKRPRVSPRQIVLTLGAIDRPRAASEASGPAETRPHRSRR